MSFWIGFVIGWFFADIVKYFNKLINNYVDKIEE